MSEETRTTSSTGGQKGVKEEQFDQIPIDALFEFARHYGRGAAKYDAHNFRKGYEYSKSFNALMRHAFAWWGGEEDDPETGTSHMAAVAWHAFNLMTLLEEHPEFDDRYKGEFKEHKPTFQEAMDAVLDDVAGEAAKRTVEAVMPKNPQGITSVVTQPTMAELLQGSIDMFKLQREGTHEALIQAVNDSPIADMADAALAEVVPLWNNSIVDEDLLFRKKQHVDMFRALPPVRQREIWRLVEQQEPGTSMVICTVGGWVADPDASTVGPKQCDIVVERR